jgi:putative flippase GtrA|tara:strand:+ start:290 stop:664 length:375 start_codon:yes stop_codon:yes gene_type:complete
MIFKLVKFIIVGFSGLFIDFGLTFICKEKLSLNKYLSNSIGFLLAASSNYFLNRIWTFGSKNPEIIVEFSSFFFVSIIGLLINNSILWLIHNKMGINFYLAKFGAILITTLWNFFANYFFTFSL